MNKAEYLVIAHIENDDGIPFRVIAEDADKAEDLVVAQLAEVAEDKEIFIDWSSKMDDVRIIK